jgi:hypothetical protein
METYKTTRIWAKTLTKLRLIAALTGTSIVRLLERLATEELSRLEAQKQANQDLGRDSRIHAE